MLLSVYSGARSLDNCALKKTYFYLHSKGTILALLLNQKDMNPGTGLQLYLCKVLLMDENGLGSTRRGEKVNFCLFHIPKDIKK